MLSFLKSIDVISHYLITFMDLKRNTLHIPIFSRTLDHTCDEFESGFREIFLFVKCIEYIFLVHFRETLILEKVVYFGKILDQFTAHFLESP